jgi:hypothetical protein
MIRFHVDFFRWNFVLAWTMQMRAIGARSNGPVEGATIMSAARYCVDDESRMRSVIAQTVPSLNKAMKALYYSLVRCEESRFRSNDEKPTR